MLDLNIANFITVGLITVAMWAAFSFAMNYLGYGSLVA